MIRKEGRIYLQVNRAIASREQEKVEGEAPIQLSASRSAKIGTCGIDMCRSVKGNAVYTKKHTTRPFTTGVEASKGHGTINDSEYTNKMGF